MKPVQTKKEFESIDNNATGDNNVTSQTNHPWNTLTTVTTFDQGSCKGSTLCLSANGNQTTGHVTLTSSSLLIQSLLLQFCTLLEPDKTRRQYLYTVICNQLRQMKLIDSYNVMEFETFKKQYHHAFSRLISIACVIAGNESIPKSLPMPKWSRYKEEFDEITLIASGAFGCVYKVRHRLDNTKYAIKKIRLFSRYMTAIDQYLNEVKTLAQLNHVNIVSYKAAWLEPLPPVIPNGEFFPNCESDSTSKSTVTRVSSIKSGPNINDSNCNDASDYETSNAADQSITDKSAPQECTKDSSDESSDVVSFRNSESDENMNESKATESKIDIYANDSASYQMCTYSNAAQNYMLHIQMTLCEQTLKEWMSERTSPTPEPIISAVLQQILRGVNYIHSKKIVHHDIKPSNIFISTSAQLQVQLGDFGLACTLQKSRHSVLGTFTYAAPEQLNGECDAKSDIYSVGIVLAELLILTRTQMELDSMIASLKQGRIPEDLTTEQHKWARMIIQMVQYDPDKRPWTTELLQDLEKDNNTKEVTDLKQTVQALTHTIREKDVQIQELKDQLASLKKKQFEKLEVSEDV